LKETGRQFFRQIGWRLYNGVLRQQHNSKCSDLRLGELGREDLFSAILDLPADTEIKAPEFAMPPPDLLDTANYAQRSTPPYRGRCVLS
jgi:hypothetical protein